MHFWATIKLYHSHQKGLVKLHNEYGTLCFIALVNLQHKIQRYGTVTI